MSPRLETTLYLAVVAAAFWLCFLWLLPRRTGRHGDHTAVTKSLVGVLSVVLLLFPFNGVALWRQLHWLMPHPSLPLIGLICAALAERLFRTAVFKRSDWTAIWVFGAVAGTALYLHYVVASGVDFYYWGWERGVSALVLGGTAVGYLILGNRLGVLLLVALLAYAFLAFDSHNCWDYVIDPFYWLASLVGVAVRLRRLRTRSPERVPARVRERE
jgi:hypothetical protein